MNVAREILADLCRTHAAELLSPLVWKDTSFDKARVLWAFCGVESSFGANCNPRHETGYCYGAKYFNPHLSSLWGCLAHCSYGPWQVMFANFPPDVSPLSLMWADDGRVAADLSLRAAVGVLNKAIARGANGFAALVEHYNGPDDVEGYSARLAECYGDPMPESVAGVTASGW